MLGRGLLRPYSIIQSLLTRTSLSNAHGMSGLFASGIQCEGVGSGSSHQPSSSCPWSFISVQRAAYVTTNLYHMENIPGFFLIQDQTKEQKEKKNKKKDVQGRDPLVNGKTFNCRIISWHQTSELPDRDMAVSFVCFTPDKG